MRPPKSTPGPWLRELRELTHATQTAVAARAGMSRSALCEHEHSLAVSPPVAGRIVEAIIALRVRDRQFDAKLREM